MEYSLDNTGVDVATTLAGYIVKSLSKKLKCETYPKN